MADIGDVRCYIHSSVVGRGKLKGYAFLFTDDRLIGVKDYCEGVFHGVAPWDETGAKYVTRLLGKVDAEWPYAAITRVGVTKEPGRFKPGKLTIESAGGTDEFSITGSFGGFPGAEVAELLLTAFDQYAPGRAYRSAEAGE